MNSFIVLLIGAAIWGATLGGAFIGGMAVGRGQADEAPAASVPTQFQGVPGQQGQFDQSQLQDLRRRIQSGEISQDELNQLRQQFREQGGPGQFRQGQGDGGQFDGRGGGQFNGPGAPSGGEDQQAQDSTSE